MAEPPQVQERGLAAGLSWAASLEVSETTLQVILRCAHQWVAWQHVGPKSKVLLQELLSFWCTRLSPPRCRLGARQHVLCLAQGSRLGGQSPGRVTSSQVSPLARGRFSVCLKGTSFPHILCPLRLADIGSKAQNFATQRQLEQSVTLLTC